MIRAFIAVDLDDPVIEKICNVVEILKSRITEIRWLRKENLHLTLKFLGNIAESQVEPIATALRHPLGLFSPCNISAKGLGVFPDFRRPKILWVGLTGDQLVQLTAEIESALMPLGFTPENRAFTPHLTIGRWREGNRPAKNLRQKIGSLNDFEFGACAVRQIVLFQSVLKPEGASYSELRTIQLGAELAGD
ncbi:MAG TPA: RNA 2',3'-cyclic phosphodiesterase [Candidatus Binatia bacterium]|nr:RNA 2',3'-cyclic phosphodiesterase [Candidatus Binatia bacterium]